MIVVATLTIGRANAPVARVPVWHGPPCGLRRSARNLMLTDTVAQALSVLLGRMPALEYVKARFRCAYASEDGRYVALLAHDPITYVVDLNDGRYCREPGGQPCGFSGHVLEMEVEQGRAARALYDLDMDGEEIAWRGCPAG